MHKTFFTADMHLCHANIIKHCNRPFQSVEDMNRTLIDNWNLVVGENDTIYHLGDLFLGKRNDIDILEELNGHIHLILGSHDNSQWLRKTGLFDSMCNLKTIRIDGQKIVLCHYAMRVWESSHHGSWHLFGHSHGGLEPHGCSFDVGVDCSAFTPINYESVKTRMGNVNG